MIKGNKTRRLFQILHDFKFYYLGRLLNKSPIRSIPHRIRIGKAASNNKGEIFLNIAPNIGISPSVSFSPSFSEVSLRLEKNKEEIPVNKIRPE
jgi:hypothetical protein